MVLELTGESFKYNGITYTIGDRIVANDESDYSGLSGTIMGIRDGEDKDTENETPDIYCTFEDPTDPTLIEELEQVFSDAYGEKKTIDDIILDEVIIEAKTLISAVIIPQPTPKMILPLWAGSLPGK